MDRGKIIELRKMEHAWDLRAREDALYYVAIRPQRWTLAEFLDHGRRTAYTVTRETFKELAFEPIGRRMLEIGCGVGRLFPGFTEMFAEVWGVDVSQEMISQAMQLHTSPKVHLIKNNGYDLTRIPDSYFDFVFSYTVFQHVPQRRMVFNYLAETHRVLKPGGCFQLHFRTASIKERISRFLPYPLRRPARVAYGLLMLYPLRGITLKPHHVLGGDASWRGTGFSPAEIEHQLKRLGFVEIKVLPDETHPPRTHFWILGRKGE